MLKEHCQLLSLREKKCMFAERRATEQLIALTMLCLRVQERPLRAHLQFRFVFLVASRFSLVIEASGCASVLLLVRRKKTSLIVIYQRFHPFAPLSSTINHCASAFSYSVAVCAQETLLLRINQIERPHAQHLTKQYAFLSRCSNSRTCVNFSSAAYAVF